MIELSVEILLLMAGGAGVSPAPDSSRCVTDSAATACSNRHRGVYPDLLANRLAVVQAGRYYFVEQIDPPTEDPEIWEIVVFTHEWKRVISFGGGS